MLKGAVLAAAFGGSAWAGYALSAAPVRPPATEPPPARAATPSPPRPSASPGDGPRAPGVPATATLGDADTATVSRPAKPADGKPIRLTFADISSWDLDPNDIRVPESIAALHGRTVDLVGYMIPYGDQDAVKEFMIVRDLGACCFGQAPMPHHVVECRFEEGKTTAYAPGPVRVRGTFRIEEHRLGQYLVSVFSMTVTDCVEVR